MPHKVEISDKTYEDLKEFCNLNDLKIGQLADKLIREGLMIEMYGDVPFTNYKRPTQEQVEAVKTVMVNLKKLENPHEDEIRDSGDVMFGNQEETDTDWPKIDEEMKHEALEKPIYLYPSNSPDEIENFREKLTEDTLKEIGIPDKVVNKITRRRLK